MKIRLKRIALLLQPNLHKLFGKVDSFSLGRKNKRQNNRLKSDSKNFVDLIIICLFIINILYD